MKRFSIVVLLLMVSLGLQSAVGYELPAVNLGFTSFMDGGPPAGPGWYFSQYMQYWNDKKLKNSAGGPLSIPVFGQDDIIGVESDLTLDAWVGLTQLIYQSDQPVLAGGKWGMNFILPTVSLDLDTGSSTFLQENSFGCGDLLIGPFLQWDPIMGANGPIFMHRVEFQFILPTGSHNDNYELNPGSNFFSFNPYWAATLFLTPQWTTSWRLHYLWNDSNDDPSQRLFPGVNKVQAGQAIHFNFASSYEVVPKTLRVGVNGYYLNQLTNSKLDGLGVPGTQEEVFGVGPGLMYSMGKDCHLFFNTYFESDVKNRTSGEIFQLRIVKHF